MGYFHFHVPRVGLIHAMPHARQAAGFRNRAVMFGLTPLGIDIEIMFAYALPRLSRRHLVHPLHRLSQDCRPQDFLDDSDD